MNVATFTDAGRHDREAREQLRHIIGVNSVKAGRDFELASGGKSDLYFEMKETLLDPQGLNIASDLIMKIISRKFPEADAIGGLVIGACPIVTAICIKSTMTAHPLIGFYVRKERKTRGACQLIDGPVKPRSNVIILDDVTTAGSSVMQAVDAARDELNCNVMAVITVVDREQGAKKKLAEAGLDLIPLFYMHEFEEWRQTASV